ncbi:MAG: aspartyl protease family protein [Gemmataceae bacterium]
MGRVAVEVEVVNYRDLIRAEEGDIPAEQIRRMRVKGIVDAGATYLVVPKCVADHLGVPRRGQVRVLYADHRRATRPVVEGVQVELLGRRGTFKAVVEPKREDVLIGAIVLEDLDLLIDCRTQTLQPRDPGGIITEIE